MLDHSQLDPLRRAIKAKHTINVVSNVAADTHTHTHPVIKK
jgi:hypothetical protein